MKSSLVALVLLCGAGVAFAQAPPDQPPGPPNAAHQLDRLATLLDLTDTQKAQVKAILDAHPAEAYISANRTCEMGLRHATGRPYESFVFLLEELSRSEAG